MSIQQNIKNVVRLVFRGDLALDQGVSLLTGAEFTVLELRMGFLEALIEIGNDEEEIERRALEIRMADSAEADNDGAEG